MALFRSRMCVHYRLPKISEKAVVLMLVWNTLFMVSILLAGTIGLFGKTRDIALAMSITVFYPIVGWLADSWIGRFKVLKTSVYLLLLTIICNAIYGFIIHSSVVQTLTTIMWSFSIVCFFSTFMQLTLDQCIGASAEQLSFTIYWSIWCFATANLLSRVAEIHSLPYEINLPSGGQLNVLKFAVLVLSSACLVGIIIIIENCSHLLMTKTPLSNPIKLFCQVLNYARKHHYPERRSAFTYWEADYPSRIDLGKDKYGGPFTVEEVEDVKTALRLIPMMFSITTFGVGMWRSDLMLLSNVHSFCYHSFRNNHGKALEQLDQLLFTNTLFLPTLLLFFGVPIYHFIIYPVCYNWIPSILKRIGIGIFFMALSYTIDALLQLMSGGLKNGYLNYNSSESCVFDNDHQVVPQVDCLWTLIPRVILALAIAMVIVFMIEFLVAQSPGQIKGFLFCVSSTMFGVHCLVGVGLDILLINFPIRAFPGCTFYYSLFYSLITFALLAFFVLISKWYKLRKRNDVIPYHLFAEDNFESNYEQERNHLLELGYDLQNEHQLVK